MGLKLYEKMVETGVVCKDCGALLGERTGKPTSCPRCSSLREKAKALARKKHLVRTESVKRFLVRFPKERWVVERVTKEEVLEWAAIRGTPVHINDIIMADEKELKLAIQSNKFVGAK